jgi:hypothetical protein
VAVVVERFAAAVVRRKAGEEVIQLSDYNLAIPEVWRAGCATGMRGGRIIPNHVLDALGRFTIPTNASSYWENRRVL